MNGKMRPSDSPADGPIRRRESAFVLPTDMKTGPDGRGKLSRFREVMTHALHGETGPGIGGECSLAAPRVRNTQQLSV